MDTFSLITLSVLAAPKPAKKGGKRVVAPEGKVANVPNDSYAREAQAALFVTDGRGTMVKSSWQYDGLAGEVGSEEISGQGFYGYQTNYRVRWHQLARVCDALAGGDTKSPYYVRNEDGSINYDKLLNVALKEYYNTHGKAKRGNLGFRTEAWYAMNDDLRDGEVKGASPVKSIANTPQDPEILGMVVNTQLSFIDDKLTEEAHRILIEDALRMTVRKDEGLAVGTSTISRTNNPAQRIIDDVDNIVGKISGFSVSWDRKNSKLTIAGKIDWASGVIVKAEAEAKFKQILEANKIKNASGIDFEKELIAEIKGGVVGYAVLAVLKVATGNDHVDLTVVRSRASDARAKQHPQPR